MSVTEYLDAQKRGKKQYRACVSKGQYPYLPVLDEILTHGEIEQEQDLGLVNVPLKLVVGTATAGRTNAFSNSFMPLFDYDSEFGAKWISLCDSHLQEGINQPIKAYEYMNRFYVVEGNKRVSVLNYFDAANVVAEVIRKVPKRTEEPSNKIYYEFMKFYEVTGMNTIYMSEEGKFQKLLDFVGEPFDEPWNSEVRMDFNSAFLKFSNAYYAKGGGKLSITVGDAMVAFLNVYEYDMLQDMTKEETENSIAKLWNEFLLLTEDDTVDLLMNPAKDPKKNFISNRWSGNLKRKLKVAFVYDKSPETSDWNYAHELGRLHLEEAFGDKIQTISVNEVSVGVEGEMVMEDLVSDGYDIIFTTTPQLINASLKAAIEHPMVKILNCSLNMSHRYIRTYYARMYEAKFITGVIAGALSQSDRLGYIADYPIFANTANINAFALGAKLVNPRAKIYLYWSTTKDADVQEFIKSNGISYVSDQDMITPKQASRAFGLYNSEGRDPLNMAMPVWHWGIFYEKLIHSILSGSWESEGETGNEKALNYWWGMSAGVVDIILSNNLPQSTGKLVNLIKANIINGTFSPFAGELISQDGTVQNEEGEWMSPEEIMTIDWLADNVVGSIPTVGELEDSAKGVVELQGVTGNSNDSERG